MIRDFNLQPYTGLNPLPTYVTNARVYILTAKVLERYEITLARLTVGESTSAGNPLSHALFESFTGYGERMKTARTRASGVDSEYVAVKSAMAETGVEFYPALPNSCETILYSLGYWLQEQNPDIDELAVMSQTCH